MPSINYLYIFIFSISGIVKDERRRLLPTARSLCSTTHSRRDSILDFEVGSDIFALMKRVVEEFVRNKDVERLENFGMA